MNIGHKRTAQDPCAYKAAARGMTIEFSSLGPKGIAT